MGTHGGPKIPTNGLILALDAGNSKCTDNGIVDTVSNIVGARGIVSGPYGQPNTGAPTRHGGTFPEISGSFGGHFDFSGGRGMRVEEALSKGTTMTQCMWFYNKTSDIMYFGDGRNDAGTYFLTNYGDANINIGQKLRYKFSSTHAADDPLFLNRWHCMIVTSDGNGSKLYLAGIEVDSYMSQISVDEDFGINYTIGARFTTQNKWTGLFGQIHFYDRALSAIEAKQYYNATKTRYK